MGSRTWFKVFADKWLSGTLREETASLRGTWTDLLALAASGKYGDQGIIQLSNKVGYTDQQIAGILCIPPEEWTAAKDRLITTERISVNGHGAISILNWEKYQSEYSRQKQYRRVTDTKGISTARQSYNRELQPRVTIEKEKENIEKEKENIGGQAPQNFQGWLEKVNTSKNKTGALGKMITTLSGQPVDFSRLGRMVKGRDPAYICKLIWDMASARPVGDWLNYLEGMLRKEGEGDGRKRQNIPGPDDPVWEEQRAQFG